MFTLCWCIIFFTKPKFPLVPSALALILNSPQFFYYFISKMHEHTIIFQICVHLFHKIVLYFSAVRAETLGKMLNKDPAGISNAAQCTTLKCRIMQMLILPLTYNYLIFMICRIFACHVS